MLWIAYFGHWQSASLLPLYFTLFWGSKIHCDFLSGEAPTVRTVRLWRRRCLCSLFTVVKFWILFLFLPISERPRLGIDFSIIECLVKTTALLTCICNAPGSNLGGHTHPPILTNVSYFIHGITWKVTELIYCYFIFRAAGGVTLTPHPF